MVIVYACAKPSLLKMARIRDMIPQTGKSYSITYFALFCHRTVNDKPKMVYLISYVRPHVCAACRNNSEVWRDLGIILLGEKSLPELDIISVNAHNNVIKCCSGMIRLWLERQPEASWDQLINALIDVQLESLAADIEGILIPSQLKNLQQSSTELQGN